MEVFQHTFTQMLMLFAIMLCGFIARKKRMTDDLFDGNLSKLVMSITLPATILNSVLSDSQLPPDEVILTMFGYATLYFLFAAVFRMRLPIWCIASSTVQHVGRMPS